VVHENFGLLWCDFVLRYRGCGETAGERGYKGCDDKDGGAAGGFGCATEGFERFAG